VVTARKARATAVFPENKLVVFKFIDAPPQTISLKFVVPSKHTRYPISSCSSMFSLYSKSVGKIVKGYGWTFVFNICKPLIVSSHIQDRINI
jgi:hypothetical protein